ncbi:MAG: PIG-L family deacetylase [Ignavibacteria bacterium]|nr:MAG: PIG-L family deacetylase [Chlorobiota bacterium]MBV6398928.1 hypothetical protein [Ignavibacteria bacterium]MCC6886233.1 PIG-L family deacetylase [Ignavibacteriales bacterium]MCE7952313.1 PIG-L family deacetylase [Chlorobi bacterium CHB7]RIK48570.1 MAG: PIG-L family deacetylase [Ignavibacteriota bacterium]
MKKFILIFLFAYINVSAQQFPRVLVAIAHPDDDAAFAGTVYRITHDLNGDVDYVLFTNGEGGYKYSTLAEDIYNLNLTDEEIGRKYLPAIRKRELMNGGKILGVRNYYFLEEQDHKYTLDITEVLDSVWNTHRIKSELKRIILKNNYDYIFVLISSEKTHAHHSSVGILTLEAVSELEKEQRPVVLGGYISDLSDTAKFVYSGMKDYPVTFVDVTDPVFQFDRTQNFGFNDRLNYKIVVNWLIAEHKSQGTMQLLMNKGDIENYVLFDVNDKSEIPRIRSMFEKLNEPFKR